MGDMYDLKGRFSDAESASEAEEPPIRNPDNVNNAAAAGGNAEHRPRFPTKEYTPTEIAQKLDGYIPVPSNLWSKLPRGSHVRYIKTDQAFKPGGFVCSFTIKDDNRRVLQLKNSFNENAANFSKWFLDLSTVKVLYKKIHYSSYIEVEMIKQMLKTHSEDIRALKEENVKIKRLLQAAINTNKRK